ncbi:MAG TPA: hypothetical protein VFX48_07760 [Saprospiraceae bacterium]|nr:hypothetical protein [Saprospiraceae bacterium]
MSQYFSYDAQKIESGNRKTGMLVSTIVHALLLLIFLLRILDFSKEPVEEIGVEILLPSQVVFEEPDLNPGGGSSAGPMDEEPMEGGSQGSEAEKAPEELERQPDKIETSKPVPVPVNPSPKPVIVAPQPEVIKMDPPKTNTPQAPTRPSSDVVTAPAENKPKPSTGGAGGGSGNASTGDNDAPGTGGSGTGSGTGTGAGGANTGSGTGGGGNAGNGTGGGSGDGTGVDFDAIGPLKRKVIWRPDIKDLARENAQIVVFDMCINRDGAVTYIKYNPRMSKTRDMKFIREATLKMQQYKFQVDSKAPRKECGTFTFNAAGMIQRLN